MGDKTGWEAKLYRNTGTYAVPVWDEITNVRDLTFNSSASEGDVTTRANAGFKATAQGLKEGSIEFEMVWDTSDADLIAIKSAYYDGSSIEFAVMDGDITVADANGLRATMEIFEFTRNEALDGPMTVSVSAKPCYADNAPADYTVASS